MGRCMQTSEDGPRTRTQPEDQEPPGGVQTGQIQFIQGRALELPKLIEQLWAKPDTGNGEIKSTLKMFFQ